MSKARTGDILYPDDRDDNGGGEFDDFLPDDATQEDIEYLGKVRDVIGQPLAALLLDLSKLEETGRISQLRGARFGSAYEAIRWLFQRGIFLFSNVVPMGDGSYGVAIGDTPTIETPEGEGLDDDSIIF